MTSSVQQGDSSSDRALIYTTCFTQIGSQGKYQVSDRLNLSAWDDLSFAHAETDGDDKGIAVNSII